MDFCLTPNEVKVGFKWNKDLNMKGKLESQSKKIWKDSLKIKAGNNFLEWQKHKPQDTKTEFVPKLRISIQRHHEKS